MIEQVTNPTKGVNHYVTPEVEMVELEANNSFLNNTSGSEGGGDAGTGENGGWD